MAQGPSRPDQRDPTSSGAHAPNQPSSLRQAQNASTLDAEVTDSTPSSSSGTFAGATSGPSSPCTTTFAPPPFSSSNQSHKSNAPPTENTPLFRDLYDREHAHDGPCDHGTFSPRPGSPSHTASLRHGDSSRAASPGAESTATLPIVDSVMAFVAAKGQPDWRRKWTRRTMSRTMSTSSVLAERHGIPHNVSMYISYYFPVCIWIREYKWSYLKGDFVAALTIAGMYLPMALSLADNLAHVPPINGLYAFVFNPFIYALLGSSPQMVLGPEAAGSLLVGSVVKSNVDRGRGPDNDAEMHARLAGVISGVAGATIFISGLARLGFLDSVLSRPFLRGFISAIGFVIFVDQLIPELGLSKFAPDSVGHGSSVDKIRFICSNLSNVHGLTAAVAATSFAIIIACREIKHRVQPRYPGIAYVPDRFLVVVLSAVFAWKFEWDQRGVQILGEVKSASGGLFSFRWPFRWSHRTQIQDALGTSFLIALLGFFESSVAAKSLGGNEVFPNIQLSANRELIALGAANLVGSCFMSIPAFGGYGRSKVNKSTGGKTPMSSIFLSGITLIAIFFVLPYFYYLPKPVLSSLISVVAWSLVEEAPHDVSFFLRIHAWTELGLMAIIFLATIFYSLNLGIAIGIGLSLLLVLRHSTRPRIQILGRRPGTDRFENAEDNPERLEFIEGCLIVKIPEPLTFANTGELKTRLRRLEMYGTGKAHPALPRLRREDSNRNVIFDIHGVTSLDGSGTQVLEEIVRSYRDRGVRVFFSRGPSQDSTVWMLLERSGIVDLVGGEQHFVDDVQDALKMTEAADGAEWVVGGERGRTMGDET